MDEHGAMVESVTPENWRTVFPGETYPSATLSIRNPTGAGLVFEPGPKLEPCYVVFLVHRNTKINLPFFTAVTLRSVSDASRTPLSGSKSFPRYRLCASETSNGR